MSSSGHRITRVWIDTDVALGGPRGDVDDGFALAALLAARRLAGLQVLGISTVFGNTTAARSEECAREILRQAGESVPVLGGAEEPGQSSSAADAIAALEPDVELLCLGPLTNVSAACRRDAKLPARLRLRAVGGNLSSPGFLPPLWPFEFNFARDRGSARHVFSQDWKSLTLYPLDVVRRLTVGRAKLRDLAGASPLGSYLAQKSRRWLARRRRRRLRRTFPLWDLPAALDVADGLGGERQTRRLARGARWWLDPPRELPCLVSFDPQAAWNRFREMLETSVC